MNDPEPVAAAIARNLSDFRNRRGLTLDQLARRSGVSKGMLVQIEQSRTNPSITTLFRIAGALGVTVARLVEVSDVPTVRVVRAAEAAVLWRGGAGSVAQLLMGSDARDLIEVWDWRLAPGEHYDGEAHPPGCQEILHVLDGTLSLSLDRVTHSLAAGDSVLFRGDRPHRYANEATEPLRFMMVVVEPPVAAG